MFEFLQICIFLLKLSLIQPIIDEIPVILQDSLFCFLASIKILHLCIFWELRHRKSVFPSARSGPQRERIQHIIEAVFPFAAAQ